MRVGSFLSAGRTRRVTAACAAACLLPYINGCYTSHPADVGVVAPGTEVSLTVNDAGRVGLGQRLGSGVLQIDGQLVGQPDTSVRIRVASLKTLSGETSHWAGEEIQLPRSYISNASTRQLSKSKTWLAVGIVAGVIAITIATVSLVGGGSESDNPTQPPGGQSMRIP